MEGRVSVLGIVQNGLFLGWSVHLGQSLYQEGQGWVRFLQSEKKKKYLKVLCSTLIYLQWDSMSRP